ncbi:hypothetical protein CMO90_04530 [Candidatus Woesearchaeota archaeon]|jgi:hypothetical protein|nr:hypothetical protein [Candidatus Woesearchaeota archaeon]|tara:strand:+ start:809 stop:1429 length:621 start_codon:yes stop_codon:yes gene_type:complete
MINEDISTIILGAHEIIPNDNNFSHESYLFSEVLKNSLIKNVPGKINTETRELGTEKSISYKFLGFYNDKGVFYPTHKDIRFDPGMSIMKSLVKSYTDKSVKLANSEKKLSQKTLDSIAESDFRELKPTFYSLIFPNNFFNEGKVENLATVYAYTDVREVELCFDVLRKYYDVKGLKGIVNMDMVNAVLNSIDDCYRNLEAYYKKW